MSVATLSPDAGTDYPIQFTVPQPESLSRLLIFVKWLLIIPHAIILYALGLAFNVISLIALFAILFTTKYPEGLFKFAIGIRRWSANVSTYAYLLRDEYPPFSLDAGQYPTALEIPYPGPMNRFLPFVKWLLAIPHLIVLAVLGFCVLLTTMVAFFAILFTGKYPAGLFDFSVGVLRWSERVNDYVLFMTDVYPPFSLKA